jgi:glycosyltransferase involved in cell wall biosynthesis
MLKRPKANLVHQLPLVSVVTPSFNQGKYVEKTILSVLAQNYPNVQYIFVDAQSTDSTQAIVHKFSKRIAHIISEKDEGQADALNKGFGLAKGDIMTYINSDDCYASEHVVSDVVQLFIDNPDIDVIYGRREQVDENGFFLFSYPFREFSKDRLYQADYIPQECTFWRKSIYQKAGSFVDKRYQFAMDYELWFRFLSTGARFLSADKVFGLFRWYPNQKSISDWKTKGLPEIARLHRQYAGQEIDEAKMINVFMEHYYGVNPQSHPLQARQFQWLWNEITLHKKRLLGAAPLDAWVLNRC